MLIRIVYASHVCAHVGQVEINELVERAQWFNREHGITGILAFDGFQVVQILEGMDAIVEPLFERILVDTRHEGIVQLLYEKIQAARFSEWSLARRPMREMLMLVEDLRQG